MKSQVEKPKLKKKKSQNTEMHKVSVVIMLEPDTVRIAQ